MEEYLMQMVHSGNRKKQENLAIPAENICPDPVPPLYKVFTPHMLDRFYSNFGSRREINSEQSHKVSNP